MNLKAGKIKENGHSHSLPQLTQAIWNKHLVSPLGKKPDTAKKHTQMHQGKDKTSSTFPEAEKQIGHTAKTYERHLIEKFAAENDPLAVLTAPNEATSLHKLLHISEKTPKDKTQKVTDLYQNRAHKN